MLGTTSDKTICWVEKGYADFSDGTFGSGGQNIYVSAAGVLQRIYRFDLNRDGYVDLLFVNSQDFNERPPAYVVTDPLEEGRITELPTLGAYSADIGVYLTKIISGQRWPVIERFLCCLDG